MQKTTSKKRTPKLTTSDRETIISRYKGGDTIRSIARDYGDKCSRRLVQLVIFPDRMTEMLARNKNSMRAKRLLLKANKNLF